MVINFLSYVEARNAHDTALKAECELEVVRREHLELILSNILSELQAA